MSTVETSEPIAQHSRILFVRVALTLRFACRLGCTPLNHAITKQSKWSKGPKVATIQELVGVCQLLILSRANVNFRDKLYACSLFVHICASAYDFMTMFLRRGYTALHNAVSREIGEVCRLLIDSRADLNARDSKKKYGQ